MQQFLALSPEDQRLTFEQTAARLQMVSSSIEKDFWVCWVLQHLFAMPNLAQHLTFKGGTSLSKAWRLIDRFSEDIDLTIGRELLGFGGADSPDQAFTSNQRGKKLKALKAACGAYVKTQVLPYLENAMRNTLRAKGRSLEIDQEDPDRQTLLFHYPSHFPYAEGRYALPVVKIEFGARSNPWPARRRDIQPMAADVFPQVFQDPRTSVQALAPERTFWEKAMLLHEETYRPADKPRKERMARHYYDLYRLIEAGVATNASVDRRLFDEVAGHRQVFFHQR
ncbi:MAG: nucleotidyl transferase AbiEii/AbiGii toxin family protein [Sterolibacterium sp.]|jgi:predicted nucleotidyltransferase component of viral defense system